MSEELRTSLAVGIPAGLVVGSLTALWMAWLFHRRVVRHERQVEAVRAAIIKEVVEETETTWREIERHS